MGLAGQPVEWLRHPTEQLSSRVVSNWLNVPGLPRTQCIPVHPELSADLTNFC